MDIEVKHDKENERFVTEVEGHKAYLSYTVFDDKIDFSYAFTSPELRGKGIAKIVVEYAFKYAKENNLKVIPTCSYVQAFVERNDNYKNLLV
ncbi:MAG: GNAT family N-acetyltransferase [Ignavibacteriaceae bacterium]|jgi:predicted GNAT family acetyltransferase